MEQTLIYFDQVNLNGHLYKKDSINIDELNGKLKHLPMFGEINHPEYFDICLARVSHRIESFKYDKEKNALVANVIPLDTKFGNMLNTMIESVVFRPRSTSTVEEDGTVNIHKLLTFDAVQKKDDAFKQQVEDETKN